VPADDLTSSRLAAPPLPPLTGLSVGRLLELGERVLAGTWRTGLTSWFWGEGVCLLGMIRYARARELPIPDDVVAWLRHQRSAGIRTTHVNNLAPGTAALLATAEHPDLADIAEGPARWLRESPDKGSQWRTRALARRSMGGYHVHGRGIPRSFRRIPR
jgi:unsaturated rhamnogalacturonyl hydrolase